MTKLERLDKLYNDCNSSINKLEDRLFETDDTTEYKVLRAKLQVLYDMQQRLFDIIVFEA